MQIEKLTECVCKDIGRFYMNYEDVQNGWAAAAKAKLLKNDFGKYFTRAVMAGFFIVVGLLTFLLM